MQAVGDGEVCGVKDLELVRILPYKCELGRVYRIGHGNLRVCAHSASGENQDGYGCDECVSEFHMGMVFIVVI